MCDLIGEDAWILSWLVDINGFDASSTKMVRYGDMVRFMVDVCLKPGDIRPFYV